MLVIGCREASPASRPGCRFGEGHEIAHSRALELDDIALVAVPDGAASLWSEPAGLFVRLLDRKGAPRGTPVRVGPRCAGGLAVAEHASRLHVACLATGGPEGPMRDKRLRPVLRWDRLSSRGKLLSSAVVADVGPLSGGVAIVSDGAALSVAWQDARPSAQMVWFSGLPIGDTAARRLSHPGRSAGHPTLVIDGRGLFAAWAETFLEAGKPRAELVGLSLSGPSPGAIGGRQTLLRVHHDAVRPQLVSGRLMGRAIAFRDRRRRGTRTGLFVASLADTGDRPIPIRVARADGDARPALCECGGRLITATPRTYAGDHFVGLNVLSGDFTRVAPEQQFYEDARSFSQAAAACVDGRPLLLIGERSRPTQGATTLRAVSVRCSP